MSDLALLAFSCIVSILYLVSNYISSKPHINEIEQEIIESIVRCE